MRILLLCLIIFGPAFSVAQDPADDLIEIHKLDYPRNAHASYCKRPLEMIDTIVFHHTETPSTDSPQRINQMHLNRGTPQDPWLMVAYTYQVSTPYKGARLPLPRIFEGRPIDIVGAHAGSQAFVPMDSEQKRMWDEGMITCGVEGGNFNVDPKQLDGRGFIKANVTTIGVDVIGNYAVMSRANPDGYSPRKVRNPSEDTLDMLARLSCQLQKKHPRIKNIRWHNFYHTTTCPGTIKNYIATIRTLAKGYGCAFN